MPAAAAALFRDRGARRVLDLGCGTGRWSIPLARAGLRVVGADRSPEMLAVLAGKPGARGVETVRCVAEDPPFARAFDGLLLSHFLHLVDSVPRIAAALARCLRPAALLVVVDSGYLPRPGLEKVAAPVMRHLTGTHRPWPRGEFSRERRLLDELLVGLRESGGSVAGRVEVVPGGTYPVARSLREHLADVRGRVWSAFRAHDPSAIGPAADAAERELLAAGEDLDAPIEELIGVRLLVARAP